MVSVHVLIRFTYTAPRASMPMLCSPPRTAHATAQPLKQEAFFAAWWMELEQHSTIELPMMPTMKMARLPLRIAWMSMGMAQHFIPEILCAVDIAMVWSSNARRRAWWRGDSGKGGALQTWPSAVSADWRGKADTLQLGNPKTYTAQEASAGFPAERPNL